MAVLAADLNGSTKGSSTIFGFPCSGADIFYRGALLWIDLTSGGATVGQAQVASIAAGDKIVGIVTKQQTTTVAGQFVDAWVSGIISMPLGTGLTLADIGDLLVHDISATQTDNPLDCLPHGDVTLAANDIAVGRIMFADAVNMYIQLDSWCGRIYDATAAAWL